MGIFGLKTFLNGLELLLKNQIAETCLLMKFVDNLMELFKQLLFLRLEVLVLLEFDLVLPFEVLVGRCSIGNLLLALIEFLNDLFMDLLLLLQLVDFFADLLGRANNLLVVLFFDNSLLISLGVLGLF